MLKHTRSITIKKSISLLLFLLVAILFSAGAATEKSVSIIDIYGRDYIAIDELIKVFSIEHSFDTVFQKGRLYYKSHYMTYKTGYSCIIIDNSIAYSEYPIIRWKGGIFIPADLAAALLDSFYNKDIQRKKNRLTLLEDEQPGKKPDKDIIISKKEKIGFIILDAGHGGKDPGAVGKGGLKEKAITLALAKKVEAQLKKRGVNIKIKLTRTSDKFIELSERAEIANRELKKGINGAFVSIHVNASVSNKISGFETYILSQNPTNEEARKTAALENNVVILENQKSRKKFDDIDYVEALMITTQIQRESSLLAASVQNNLKKKIKEFKSRGVNKADFFVLRGALMPAVLVEVGFITHPQEIKYLQKDDYQDKLTEGIVEGIITFINQYNKLVD
ncbi:MAG: N-acetylmuramoyl-L-alanine amidase [Leptospirales bacterium]|nr:N-acetylmuramoyl-L-alanine amidase [Leptospirales bacterium]